MASPSIQWYPGHIAKAERALVEQLKRVDVVLEVRDARIPLSTEHPQVSRWIGERQRLLILNRVDMVPDSVRQRWQCWFAAQDETPYWANAKQGKGIGAIAQAAQRAGRAMNQRRRDRGMRPRPVRAVVIGFPNVGKSALINRLLNRKVVESARRAGVTRQLRWVRISDQLELLDAPGVIPAHLTDQDAALKLAICDDIGAAAYDTQRVAAAFVDLVKQLDAAESGQPRLQALQKRFGLDPADYSGETYLVTLAETQVQGDIERAARQLLTDFRKGSLGEMSLEQIPD